jgi:hypothetical protein
MCYVPEHSPRQHQSVWRNHINISFLGPERQAVDQAADEPPRCGMVLIVSDASL